ncbi:hypothetical protein LTR04_001932, partial [Oleoguttula sp. CCFEE 6159]
QGTHADAENSPSEDEGCTTGSAVPEQSGTNTVQQLAEADSSEQRRGVDRQRHDA